MGQQQGSTHQPRRRKEGRRKIQPGQSVVEMMHACFHGGGSGSRITKSVAAIRDLTKSMKAMTLKVKGGGRRARARRRRRAAEDEDPHGKDASSSASSSAKIAPAQPHEDEDEQGGAKHEHCDKCLAEEEGEGEEGTAAPADGEWMAEPEPGVLMTLAPRGDGANYLRRIRFSEDHFPDACAAHEWWAHNYDRIVELYSLVVQSENASHREEDDDDDDAAAPVTPCQSEDDEHQRPDGELEYSASCSASGGSNSNFSGPSSGSGSGSANKVDSPILGLVTEPNNTKRSPQAKRNRKAGDSRTLTLSES
ncbi:hypothetical protein PR202_ga19966 [Eleusine coracana subsp. coracana]|uniref:BRX domain-containing protein n=1 Tax=Eleusine coracana subsp. coracana TaxID=191504 RepID=A0AAV5CWY7_ELECO|nr:hypothetical protein PR202_ga19966 [Eleusine coracana subsp. coracana]